MKLQFLSPDLHGFLDFAAAIALIGLPILLDLGSDSPMALWLSIGGGIGLILYSLLTDYALGAARVIPYSLHLALDLLAAIAFVAAPFLFGFAPFTMAYYLVMAAGVILVVIASERPAATA